MSLPTIAERVAAGAQWLNDNVPDWWQRIDLDRLDVRSECRCVLGQIYGHYSVAPKTAWWSDPDHGYGKWLADWRGFDTATDDEVEALTAEWRRVIEAHRASLGGAS